MYLNLARELKKNTDIMEATFKKLNLKILQFSYRPYSDDDADCELIIELTTISGDTIPDDVTIRINLYDENGDIICTSSNAISEDEFSGYDTITIDICNDSRTLLDAKSARLYMVKGWH